MRLRIVARLRCPLWLGRRVGPACGLVHYRDDVPARLTDGIASGAVLARDGDTWQTTALPDLLAAPPDALALVVGDPTIVRFNGLHKLPALPAFLAALRDLGVRVWLDLDDDWLARAVPPCLALPEEEATTAGDAARLALLARDADACRAALGAVCGAVVSTPTLADVVRPHTPRVVVGPNALADRLLPPPARDPARPLRIGAAVANLHARDMPLCWRGMLEAARASGGEVALVGHPAAAGVPAAELPRRVTVAGVPVLLYPVLPFRPYLDLVGTFDLAAVPLLDLAENRAKSACKWLEYSLHAVPGVYAALPPYAGVAHGVTGLLARTATEYTAALLALATDPALRTRIGAAAQAAAHAGSGLAASAPRWRAAIDAMRA